METTETENSMQTDPRKEHEWLQQLVGEWDYVTEMNMGPELTQTFKGTETVRSLGGLWAVAEATGEFPGGGEATMLVSIGYDLSKNRYVGTFIGSMMSTLWVYDGEMDADQKVLTLSSVGPHMMTEGKTANYRDVIEIKGEDQRSMTALVQGDDGEWTKLMTISYQRRK